MIRETVVDGEPALAVDTEEEFNRALGSGVWVVPPSWEDALAWHPWVDENTDSLEDVRRPGPDVGRCVRPTRMVYSASVGLGPRLKSARSRSDE